MTGSEAEDGNGHTFGADGGIGIGGPTDDASTSGTQFTGADT